jgi:anti-sigma regulatory factor (Ser/Thr protein kinase)
MSEELASVLDAPFAASWSAVPGSISQARTALSGYARDAGASQRTRDAVALAVSEAVANSVVHGFPDSAAGFVEVSAHRLDANRLQILVVDNGCGLNGVDTRSSLGLGLALIAQLTEHVTLENAPQGGTSVSMDFLLLT